MLSPRPAEQHRTSPATALRLVGFVWCEIYVVQGIWPGCVGTALAFSLAIVTVEIQSLKHRGWWSRNRPTDRRMNGVSSFVAYAMVGLLIQPWLGFIALEIHSALVGDAPRLSPTPPDCAWQLGATLVLAPIFEERLCRGILLPPLETRVGTFGAVVVSSLVFAIPHADSLPIIGTFLAGIVLGATAVRTRRIVPCIAMHVGFNAAAIGAATFASRAP